MSDNQNIHQGHRKKVREKYYESGLKGMADHNILEFLLFFGIPYKDTNPIAHALIDKFGSFSGVFQASMGELIEVKGMTENAACLINMILPLYRKFSEDLLAEKKTLETTKDIVEYIKPQFFGCTYEKVYALCFDSSMNLIKCKELSKGDVSSAMFDMRLLASTVLETKAYSVVLVHNHPNGIAVPSPADVEVTINAFNMLKALKVRLENHIIISNSGFGSMIDMPRFEDIFYN